MILSSLTDIIVKADDTDHLDFKCPDCKVALLVEEVKTAMVATKPRPEKCTWIRLHCPKCQRDGQRKFYWKP